MAKPFAYLSPVGELIPPLISLRGSREEEREMNRWRGAPFTPSQWQELETQALVFKYFVAGVPVPPDLLLAVRASFESMAAARFYHHSSLGYGGYFGKKIDPEPGRCRRTDGKKWRCAKEAAPDSKYCERHMHRGRNRSRKPVEAPPPPQQQTNNHPVSSQPPSPASTVTSNSNGIGIASRVPSGNGNGSYISFGASTGGGSQLQIDPGSYNRYPYGVVKTNMDEQSLFSEASGTLRCVTMGSQASHFSLETNNSNSNPYQLPNSFVCNDYSRPVVVGPTKEERNLRQFFDEWPRTRDENDYSFSSTQLSISIPMASSDFSTPSSRSPDQE